MNRCDTSNSARRGARAENLRKGGSKRKSRQVLTDQQRAFCAAYVRTGSACGAAVYAGYHPASGYRLLENPSIQTQIRKLQEQAEKREERRAERTFALDREFLDVNLAHLIANGKTHPARGDADKVKAIEVGYRSLGIIQPSHVVNQAMASTVGGIPAQDRSMFGVYKARWLIEKEAAMAAQLEQQYGPTPRKEREGK